MSIYWNNILIFFSILIMSTLTTIFFFLQISQKTKTSNFKESFECGFNFKIKPHSTFSINYFFMTIIFLIFDLEILVLMPMIMYKITYSNSLIIMFFMALFGMILTIEWNNSLLEWQT